MGQPIRKPTAWAAAQRDFRQLYQRNGRSLQRQPARIRWWTNNEALAPERFTALAITAVGTLRRWRSGKGTVEGTYVAVYAPSAAPGARPVVCFAVPNGSFAEPAGSSDAMVVGEVGLNGVCCVELPDGTIIWPSYNPTVPTGRFPGAP